MFVNKLKMDGIAEAVKKCMAEDDLEETGLRKAAYAAHTKGEKMFTFKGKTYPVKVQGEDVSYGEAVKEETEIDEAMSGEVTRTKTGLVHRSTKAYGGSKPEKHVVDTLKGPKTKDLIKKDVKDELKSRGRYDEEMEFKNKLLEALKGKQHKIDKNKNQKIDAQDFAMLRAQQKEEVELDEASCEDEAKQEVKKHEKKMHGKEGEVAKHVEKMHKEDVEQIDELKKSTLGSYVKKAAQNQASHSYDQGDDEHQQYYSDEDPERDKDIQDRQRKIDNRAKGISRAVTKLSKEEVELDEKAGYSAKAARAGKDIGKPGKMFAKIAAKAGKRYGSKERGEKVAGAILAKLRKEQTEADWSDEQLDQLLEYYDLAEKEMTDAEMAKREKIVKGMKKSLAGFKQRYGARAKDVMYATATKQAMKEEVKKSDIPAFIRKARGDKPLTVADAKAGSKDSISSKENLAKARGVSEGKHPESDTVPFVTNTDQPPFDKPYTKIGGTVTDKSGAKHTPMSRARDLARSAMKRIKTEMLGKAPGNNG